MQLTTAEQVEIFSWSGQDLVPPITADLGSPDVTIASVEAVAALGMKLDHQGREPLPWLQTTDFQQDDSAGYWKIGFNFNNQLDKPLERLRIGIICKNADGNIIGADYAFPGLIGPGADYRIETNQTILNGNPSECLASVNYDSV